MWHRLFLCSPCLKALLTSELTCVTLRAKPGCSLLLPVTWGLWRVFCLWLLWPHPGCWEHGQLAAAALAGGALCAPVVGLGPLVRDTLCIALSQRSRDLRPALGRGRGNACCLPWVLPVLFSGGQCKGVVPQGGLPANPRPSCFCRCSLCVPESSWDREQGLLLEWLSQCSQHKAASVPQVALHGLSHGLGSTGIQQALSQWVAVFKLRFNLHIMVCAHTLVSWVVFSHIGIKTLSAPGRSPYPFRSDPPPEFPSCWDFALWATFAWFVEFVELGFEPRIACMPGRHSTT